MQLLLIISVCLNVLFAFLCVQSQLQNQKIKDVPEKYSKQVNAFMLLMDEAEKVNNGWQPDWSNNSQLKYYPWFMYDKSGSGLSYGDYVIARASTGVGSRLFFKDYETAEAFGKKHISLYTEFLSY